MAQKLVIWEIDQLHSSANFSVKHMMISKVHGGFLKFTSVLRLDREHLDQSSVEAIIDATSIDTRESKRDEHLKSPDFFDVVKHPTITFKSKHIEAKGEEQFTVTGDLTIRGVTREVFLDVESSSTEMKDPYGNLKLGASASTKIKRKDFGLTWNAALEAGGVLVGDDITITLDLQFIKKS